MGKPLTSTRLAAVCAVLWILSANLLGGGEGVRIENLNVPDSVRNGSSRTVLDCVYSLENPMDKEGLVVKWYFNDHPNPVYQWIPNKRPQDLGVLKGKLNLDYRASDDESMAHRALEIVNPTIDLSGEYRCAVSTFTTEATQSKKMVIYVPEKSLKLTQEKQDEDKVILKCSAEGLYPEPNMTISSSDRSYSGHPEVKVVPKNGLYDIVASVSLQPNLEASTTFECILRIPETDYSVTRALPLTPDNSGGVRTSFSAAVIFLLSVISTRL